MISKPILIIRMPEQHGEKYKSILNDVFSEELNGQYNVFVTSEETEDPTVKFEVHGVPNSPANELDGTDKMRAAVALGHKPDDVQADANVSRVREYKKKESVVKAILWDGSDEAYNELCAFAAVPVIKKDGWLWVKVDPEYGPSLHIGHYLIRDEEGELHAVESIHFLSQFELK